MCSITIPRLALTALSISAASCATDVETSRVDQPIINGMVTGSDLSVVAMADRFGTVYCTATMISPRVAVTAAHCLARQPAFVFVGSDSSLDGAFLDVAGAMAHPDSDGSEGADIGVVWLQRPTPIVPMPINTIPLAEDVIGKRLRFVGFGSTGTHDTGIFGLKHSGYAELTAVDELWLSYGVIGCHGDSGGPAFLLRDGREVLVGVTSHGDPACAIGGSSTRVDRYADWILEQVRVLDPSSCRLDGRCASSCTEIDPDCVIDRAPVGDGDPVPADVVGNDVAGCSATRRDTFLIGIVTTLLVMTPRRRRSHAPTTGTNR